MNKLVVVAKNPDTYFIKRLSEEVKQDHLAIFNPWQDLVMPEAERYLVRTTGVYGSDLDLLMLQSLPAEKVINPVSVLKRFRSKSSQYFWMEEENFPILHWLPLKGTELITIEKFFRLYPEVVVKPTIGQGGWGVEVLKWDQFKSWWKKKQGKDENYLIQPLVRGAKEFRHFFIKGGQSYTLERKSASGIAANFQKQGAAQVAQLDSKALEILGLLVEKSEALYGAIDFFLDGNRLILLELNTVPGIEQLESVTKANIIGDLLNAKFFCQIT